MFATPRGSNVDRGFVNKGVSLISGIFASLDWPRPNSIRLCDRRLCSAQKTTERDRKHFVYRTLFFNLYHLWFVIYTLFGWSKDVYFLTILTKNMAKAIIFRL